MCIYYVRSLPSVFHFRPVPVRFLFPKVPKKAKKNHEGERTRFSDKENAPSDNHRLIVFDGLFFQQSGSQVDLPGRNEADAQPVQYAFAEDGLEDVDGGLVIQAFPRHAVDV